MHFIFMLFKYLDSFIVELRRVQSSGIRAVSMKWGEVLGLDQGEF